MDSDYTLLGWDNKQTEAGPQIAYYPPSIPMTTERSVWAQGQNYSECSIGFGHNRNMHGSEYIPRSLHTCMPTLCIRLGI